MKLLLVEDNKDIADVIFDFFESAGVQMDYAANGIQGASLAETGEYDGIILDLMLPGIDGLTVSKQLRAKGVNTPIIMLTARDTNDDILWGFESGADDYVIKPFELDILYARVKAVIRRTSGIGFNNEIRCQSVRVDVQARKAYRDNTLLKLNPTCFAILLLLARKYPNPVSRGELEQHLWGDDVPDEDILRKHIYHLRSVIDKPFSKDLITNIPKVGYAIGDAE